MSKLVDKERLAKLAKALDDRAKAAVKAEENRALAAEQAIEGKADANAEAIETLNGGVEEAGSVAKAVADAVKVEADRAKEEEGKLADRIAANEAFVAAQPGKDKAQDDRLAVIEEMMGLGGVEGDKTALEELQESINAVQEAAEAAQGAADAAQGDVDAVEQRLDAEGGLVDRIEANEANIARLDGAVEVAGSVKKQIKDAIDEAINDVNDAASALEARVEANEDDIAEINGVIGVPAAEGVEATGMHKLIADEDARILGEAKAHAEQKIADLVGSAPEALNTLQELADAIENHQDVYDTYIGQHATAMATMKEELQGEIDTDVAAEAALRVKADETLQNAIDLKASQADFEAHVTAQTTKDAAVDAAIEAAQAAADKAQGDVDAVEGRMTTAEQGIADNKAAIEQEAEDRDAAIEKALKIYSTTEEMKLVIGNVVNSLELKMENDQVVLKLGSGADGIELTSVSLDLATDADIDAIIAGLDTPAAE